MLAEQDGAPLFGRTLSSEDGPGLRAGGPDDMWGKVRWTEETSKKERSKPGQAGHGKSQERNGLGVWRSGRKVSVGRED